MISFDNAKIYKIYNGFRFYQHPKNPYFITYLSENSSFLKDYHNLNISRIDVKNIVMPITKIPRSYPSSQDRQLYKKYKLYLSSPRKLPTGKNVIFDISKYLYLIDSTYKPMTYRQKAGKMIQNIVRDAFYQVPSNYEKILMYSVRVDKDFNPSYINRKIFLFLEEIHDNNFPYDHFILCLISENNVYYRILIKNREYFFNRLKQYIKNIREIDVEKESEENEEREKLSQDIIKKITNNIEPKNKDVIKNVLADFIEQHPEEVEKIVKDDVENNKSVSASTAYDLVSIAILVQNNRNIEKSKKIVQNTNKNPLEKFKKIEKQFVDEIIPIQKPTVDNDSVLYEKVKIADSVDNIGPDHIFEKRKKDFTQNLKKDIALTFKSLDNRDVPLKIQSVKFENSPDQSHNLNKSDITVAVITLFDKKGKNHTVRIQIPKINKDGTFFINGKRKCLINQIYQLPIQFPKPFEAKFESSYSMFYIYSKHLAKVNYLQIFMGTYKLPLSIVMFYGFGFDIVLKKFDIKYMVQDEAPPKDTKYVLKIDGKYYIFHNIHKEVQIQFINSLLREDLNGIANDSIELFSKAFFSKFIIKDTGRVNSVYLIQNNFDNIVDNISKSILASKGYPTKLADIMYYMSVGAVEGYTIKRNDLDNQRIRSSEIISHLLQKEVLTAYTIYKEKYLAGNEDAKFEMAETKLLSEFSMAEIVANMEYANPIEELSVMTRVSPIGKNIGGVPNKDTITLEGRSLHKTYFGNIDPVDTPEGPGVGVTQHLAIGAAISTSRGLFSEQKDAMKKPTTTISTTTAMIPFMQNNDGNRVMFGSGQMKQAVPLKNPEPPIVQTGYESILTHNLSDNFIKRSECSGKVLKITDSQIFIQCKDSKKIEKIDLTPVHLSSGSGRDTLSEFNVVVKEGQTVKQNQRIAEGASIKDGFLSLGRNLCAAFMSWKGYNFEDGIVVNESVIKNEKLKSLHGMVEEVQLSKKDKILDIIKIGTHTKHGDVLLKKSIGDLDELLGIDDSDDEDLLTDFADGKMIKKSPGGVIANIEIFSNDKPDKFPEYVQEIIKKTNKRYGNPKLSYRNKKGPIQGTLIKFYINQEMNLMHGDKMTNRHGAKGVISLIEKEENMPLTPWGDKVEIILNPVGVINRMNVGQLLEMNMGLVSKVLALQILKNKNSKSTVIKIIKNVLKLIDKTNKQVIVSSIISTLNAMSSTKYKQFIEELESYTFFPIIIPPYKSPKIEDIYKVYSYLKLPKTYHLYLPEYKSKTIEDVAVGYIYYEKLEHIGNLKLHSRSTGPVIAKTGQPTAGKRKGGGVRVGESDVYALLAHNSTTVVNELFGAMSDGAQSKNEEISNILMNGHTKYVHQKSSPTGNLLRAYLVAMMIEKG